MSPEEILAFIRVHELAIVATVSDENLPQAALMGIAVMPDARIIFDTVKSSGKYSNLRAPLIFLAPRRMRLLVDAQAHDRGLLEHRRA